jgi:hypothetical protein
MARDVGATSGNRVEAATDEWMAKEKKSIAKYGPNVLNDKDFNRAKLAALREIHKEFAKQNLSRDEKIDHRILKGQVRQIERRLYPKLAVRQTVRLARFIGRQISAAWKTLTEEGPASKQRVQKWRNSNALSRPQAVVRDLTNRQSNRSQTSRQSTVPRKQIVKQRSIAPTIPGKGLSM